MAKIPEKLGSEYYRGFLTRQGQAFYDRINAQLLRGDYSGKTTFSLSNPETSASDCFAAYKAIRDDHPEFFYLGYQSEFTRRSRTGTLEYPILYTPDIINRIQQQMRKSIYRIVRGTAGLSMLEREVLVYERIAKKLAYTNNGDVRDHSIVGPILQRAYVRARTRYCSYVSDESESPVSRFMAEPRQTDGTAGRLRGSTGSPSTVMSHGTERRKGLYASIT